MTSKPIAEEATGAVMNPAVTRAQLLSVGVTLFVIAVILPFAVFAVPQAAGADHSYVVLSNSMAPAIDVGDAVIVDSVAATSIRVGDVITYRRPGDVLVTHRVIAVSTVDGEPVFQTQGDNNEDPDPQPVQAEAVVGRVSYALPYVGYVVSYTGTPIGFAALIGIPILLLIASEVWSHRTPASEHRSEPHHGWGPLHADNRLPDQHIEQMAAEPAVEDDPAVVSIGPGTDLTLTIGVLGILAIFSAAIGIRTGFPEAYVMSAFAVLTIVALLYLTRDRSPDDTAASDDPPSSGRGGTTPYRDTRPDDGTAGTRTLPTDPHPANDDGHQDETPRDIREDTPADHHRPRTGDPTNTGANQS